MVGRKEERESCGTDEELFEDDEEEEGRESVDWSKRGGKVTCVRLIDEKDWEEEDDEVDVEGAAPVYASPSTTIR